MTTFYFEPSSYEFEGGLQCSEVHMKILHVDLLKAERSGCWLLHNRSRVECSSANFGKFAVHDREDIPCSAETTRTRKMKMKRERRKRASVVENVRKRTDFLSTSSHSNRSNNQLYSKTPSRAVSSLSRTWSVRKLKIDAKMTANFVYYTAGHPYFGRLSVTERTRS